MISSQDEEDQLWEADYGTEVASQPLFNRDDPEIAISGKETESLMDALSVSVPDFEQLEFLNDQEIELKSTILPSKSQVQRTNKQSMHFLFSKRALSRL